MLKVRGITVLLRELATFHPRIGLPTNIRLAGVASSRQITIREGPFASVDKALSHQFLVEPCLVACCVLMVTLINQGSGVDVVTDRLVVSYTPRLITR